MNGKLLKKVEYPSDLDHYCSPLQDGNGSGNRDRNAWRGDGRKWLGSIWQCECGAVWECKLESPMLYDLRKPYERYFDKVPLWLKVSRRRAKKILKELG